jgi:crotonobetainyl-CoA:carnitine CoA-transferase CaiB-like acyl-CoA transferase
VTALLAPYRVLDLTDGRAELATLILAGMGADVIKVEPPGGSTSRSAAPVVPGEPDSMASLAFHAYNRGKRSVVLDLGDEADCADFLALAATADFVFENAGPGVADAAGVGFAAIKAVRPDVVYVALSPFGQTGPYADHASTDLTLAAMGGAMALNGDRDRRPVRITVPQTWHHAAAESALGALVAHERRVASGEAQFVDMAVQTAVFWTGLNAMISSAIDGQNLERGGTALQLSTITAELVYPCADGEICMFFMGATLLGLIPWMREQGIVDAAWVASEDWSTYERRILGGEETIVPVDELRAKITEFTRRQTKAEVFAGAIARNLTLVPVNTAADTMAMEQLHVRSYWDAVQLPSGRTVQAPGAFAKLSNSPIAWQRGAPQVGEHTRQVLDNLAPVRAHTAPAPTVPAVARRALPLEGVKVADFSWIGVGPITAKSLADHGATVVHIESESPADRLRLVGPFKDDIAGINRCQFFGSFNTSKLSLQLDLKHPTGNDVARQVLEWCDIALDSFTAGTMARLGLGYETARALNPEIIMATTCLFGQSGPVSPLAGYGYHAAAISGFYEMTGWDDRPPGGPWNAYTDTIAPRFLTTTLLAALDHRRRTGQGQYIDQAQMESALHFQAPQLLEVQVSGKSARRNGNVDAECSPHDAYPCAGDDQWCAIAIETDEHWRSLCKTIGEPGWAEDPELATVDGRRSQHEMIDDRLAQFTRQHEPRELMILLQDRGVPAGMVQRSSDHLQDPQLAHRNFFRPMQHPEMGEVPYEGHQYMISGYDNGPRMPAPCLGEHTFEVLTNVLGMSVDEATEILISGACG